MSGKEAYKELRKLLSPYYRHTEVKCKYLVYSLRKNRILREIRGKKCIRVAFFTINVAMWKCDELFGMLLQDPHFEPVIVQMPRPGFNKDNEREEQIRMQEYCRNRNFPFIAGYDYEKDTFAGADEIKPDIVFFGQPYNAAYPPHKIEAFWKKSLFCYIPYCFTIERYNRLADNLLKNICITVFCENEMIRKIESGFLTNSARNFKSVGYVCENSLNHALESDYSVWKPSPAGTKRVVWAPHHSIMANDILNYSNFMEIADEMVLLAKEYVGKVQFIFKPHPGLKGKLYNLPEWGKERTDRYYRAWDEIPGCSTKEGAYLEFFRSSDAMIHDSSSFTVEYLYTGHPVMYISKPDHLEFMNEFGKMCYDMHYKGHSIQDIRDFLDDVVIGGKDRMQQQREDFRRNCLSSPGHVSAAENIYRSLVGLFNSQNDR